MTFIEEQRPFTAPKCILISIDGSSNSKRALNAAIRLAKDYNAKLVILNVIPTQPLIVDTAIGIGAPQQYYEYAEEDAKKLIREASGQAEKEGVEVRGDVIRGTASVVQAITEYAEEQNVDLIVVGTRGLGGFKKMLVGSVSSGVLAHAHCNVLIVR